MFGAPDPRSPAKWLYVGFITTSLDTEVSGDPDMPPPPELFELTDRASGPKPLPPLPLTLERLFLF